MKKIPAYIHATLLFFVLSFCSCALFAQATSAPAPTQNVTTEVITLQNRTPQDVIPIITPFLAQGGQAKGFENQIIIQSTPDNIDSIKQIIQKIDIVARQLLITISNGHDKPNEIMSISPSGDVRFGHSEHEGPHTEIIGTNRESERQVSSIRVNNGDVGYINAGVTIALPTEQAVASANFSRNSQISSSGGALGNLSGNSSARGNFQGVDQSYEYQNLTNGFFVRPQLVGEQQVRLELSTQNNQPPQTPTADMSKPVYTTFHAQTTMTVPLGQWINFGGNRNTDELDTSGNVYRTGSRDQSQRFLWLRVDIIPDQ